MTAILTKSGRLPFQSFTVEDFVKCVNLCEVHTSHEERVTFLLGENELTAPHLTATHWWHSQMLYQNNAVAARTDAPVVDIG